MQTSQFTTYATSLSINFLNTVQMRHHAIVDLLQTNEDVVLWGEKMVEGKEMHPVQYDKIYKDGVFDLLRIRHFRSKCREIIRHILQEPGEDESFWPFFEERIGLSPLSFQVAGEQLIAIPEKSETDGLLSLLSFDFLKIKEAGQMKRIKKCANEACIALFIDHSGRRKWCSMQECGNRDKVRRFLSKRG